MAFPALKNCYERAEEIIVCFYKQEYVKVGEILTTAMNDVAIVEEKLLNAINQNSMAEWEKDNQDKDNSRNSRAVDFVKSESGVILSESKRVFRIIQCFTNTFRAKEQSLNAVENHLEKILETLKSFVNQYGGGSRLNDSLPSLNRRSLLQSPKDRLILSRNIVIAFSNFPGMLMSSIISCRQTIKSFVKSIKQSKEQIIIWQKQNKPFFNQLHNFKENLADLTVAEDAENVHAIIQRLIKVAEAENSLTFFETSSSTPKDRTERANIAVHIKDGLKILCESDHITDSSTTCVDLCYNRSECSFFFSNQDKFPYTVTVLKCFSILFPERLMVARKKAAEIQLVELNLFNADEEAKQNSAKYALSKAIAAQNEKKIEKALQTVQFTRGITDATFIEAERVLRTIRLQKRSCRDALRVGIEKKDEKMLQEAITSAEKHNLSVSDPLLLSAKQTLERLRFCKNQEKASIEELRQVAHSNDFREIRFALAKARACNVPESNSYLQKIRKNFDRHQALIKLAETKDRKFFDSLKQKINYSDKDSSHFDQLVVTSDSVSLLQLENKEKQNSLVENMFIQYLQNEIDAVLSVNTSGRINQTHLHLLLKYAEKEKKEIPKDICKASQTAMKIIDERQIKAKELQQKLVHALKEESIDDLALAIDSADADPVVLDCKVSENTEELVELTAKAKHCFALLNFQRKLEEKEKAEQHVSLARKKLKKALIQDGSGRPLKEAVETFRLVCSSVSPRFSNENDKQEKKINAYFNPKPVIFSDKRKKTSEFVSFRKKEIASKQEECFLVRSNKTYQSASSSKGLINKPIQTKSASAAGTQTENNQILSGKGEAEKRQALSARPHEQGLKAQLTNSSDLINDISKSNSNSTILTSAVRPRSAPEECYGKNDLTPPSKIAWSEIEKKNFALLRKAEKSLKKKEKKEKKKEDVGKKEFLDNIKDELLANLQTSVNSKDRLFNLYFLIIFNVYILLLIVDLDPT